MTSLLSVWITDLGVRGSITKEGRDRRPERESDGSRRRQGCNRSSDLGKETHGEHGNESTKERRCDHAPEWFIVWPAVSMVHTNGVGRSSTEYEEILYQIEQH
jgi:hypothetical protein